MGTIKFRLLFIISSLLLMLLPVGAMANTLQPGQGMNDGSNDSDQQNEETETQNNESNAQEEQDGTESSGEEENWTGQDNYNGDTSGSQADEEGTWDTPDNSYDNFNENFENDDTSDWTAEEEYIEPEPEPEPEYEEPVIEEPVIEEPLTGQPQEVEDPAPEVNVNTLEVEEFSVSGTVIDGDGEGVNGVELILTGDDAEEKSVESEDDGRFLFEAVPSGQFEIEVQPGEEYETSSVDVEVTDRSKKGLKINLTASEEAEASEPVETDENVMAEATGGFSSMDMTLIVTGIVFILISISVFIFKKVRNN